MKNNYPVFSWPAKLNYRGLILNLFITACLNMLLPALTLQAKTIYITPTGAGNQSGSSWANACTLYAACMDNSSWGSAYLDGTCRQGDQMWLAQGTYDDVGYSSEYLINCDWYGGFFGNETSLSQRTPGLNPTIIANQYDNSTTDHRFVDFMYDPSHYNYNGSGEYITNNSAVLFTIDGIYFSKCYIRCDHGGQFQNCTFDNSPLELLHNFDYGVLNYSLSNCEIKNFTELGSPANPLFLNDAIYVDGYFGVATFNNCNFHDNAIPDSTQGSIVYVGAGVALTGEGNFYDCKFLNNYSPEDIITIASVQDTQNIISCLFANNITKYGSEVGLSFSYVLKVISSTFANNQSLLGSANAIQDYGSGWEILANNIFWNPGGAGSDYFRRTHADGDVFTANIIKNSIPGWATGNNYNFDPLLNADYTMSACSPAVNKGDNAWVNGQTTDLAGNQRVVELTVDPGCYECQSATAQPFITCNDTFICPGTRATLMVDGYGDELSFTWYGSDGSLYTLNNSIYYQPIVDTTTTYSLGEVTLEGCTPYTNSITVHTYPTPIAATSATQSPDTFYVCAGTVVSATANPGSGGGPGSGDIFRYTLDGGNTWQPYTIGANINTLSATGVVFIEAQRGGGTCTPSQWSEIAFWFVNPLYTPVLTINSPASVTQGQAAVFTANVTNGGNSPTFQWSKNGVNAGTNSATYTDNSPVNGEIVACTVTSNANECLSTPTATASVTLEVNSLTITDPTNCTASIMTAHFINTPAQLQWWDGGYYGNYTNLQTVYATWGPGTTVAGGHGQGPGLNQFFVPYNIFVDASGNIYIADEGNNRVMKWAPGAISGTVVAGGNGAGGGPNQLNSPAAVTVDALGNIYVLDRLNYRVQKWAAGASSGTTVAAGHGNGSAANQIGQSCEGMYVTPAGNIYLADGGNGRVQRWSPGDTTGTTILGDGNWLDFEPVGIFVDSHTGTDVLYITDWYYFGESVQKFVVGQSTGFGTTVAGGNGAGSASNQLTQPTSVSATANGDVFVVDASNNRVQLWRSGADTGVTIAGGPVRGSAANQFYDCYGIAVDAHGNIYVSDIGPFDSTAAPYTRVQKFSPTIADTTFAAVYINSYTAQAIGFDGSDVTSNLLTTIPVEAAAVTITASVVEICTGGYVTFTPISFYPGTAPSYNWYVNNILKATTTGNYITNALNVGDSVYCVLTTNEPCASSPTAISNSITMQPYVVTVSIGATPSYSVCSGTAVTFTPYPINGGSAPTFQWFDNGVEVGANATYTSSQLNNGDVITCVCSSSAGCGTQAAGTSPPIVMQVATDNISATGTCPGSQLTASVPGIPAMLQWLRNDTIIRTVNPAWNQNATTLIQSGANNQYYNTLQYSPKGIFVDRNDNIYICDAPNFRVLKFTPGDTVGMVVAGGGGQGYDSNQLIEPFGVYVDTAGNVFVADYNEVSMWTPAGVKTKIAGAGYGVLEQFTGTTSIWGDKADNIFILEASNNAVVELTAASNYNSAFIVGGGNGVGSGANQLNATTGLFVDDSDNVYAADWYNNRVQKFVPGSTSGITVAGGNGYGTGPNQTPAPTGVFVDKAGNIYVQDNGDQIQMWAPGASSGITIVGGNGTGPAANQINPYGFMVDQNGDIYVTDQTNNRVQKFSLSGIADTITAVKSGLYTANIISFGGCNLTSNTDTIIPPFVPSVSIIASADTFCSGATVSFTATPTNGGSAPTYQWLRNGIAVGSSSPVYSDNIFNNSDVIKCVLTSNATCVNPATANSNSITLTVNPTLVPGLGLATSTGFPICAGSGANFIAQPQNGGTSPSYQWYLNGNAAGSNSPNYSSNALSNNDKLYCVMTSNATCASPATANSDTVTITVNPLLTPSVSLSVSGGSDTTCAGTAVTFIATPFNAGTSILYVFKVNGNTAQVGSSATFTTSALNNNDSVSCSITILNNRLCVTTTAANSNSITMVVGVAPVINCPGPVSLNTDLSLCSSSTSIGTATATGGCGNVTITHSPMGPYPVGNTTVTWKAIDQYGDSSTCTQLVTVTDNEHPTITCPATVNVTADLGHCYASGVSLGIPVTNDNCGVLSVTNNAPTQYPVGSTTVIWTITDIHNNTNTCNQTVNVTDNQLPTITCPATVNVTADAGHCYASGVSLGTPVTNDNCGVLSITNNAPSQYPVGSTTVIWTITDIHNNINTCNQIVNVTDNQVPVITCPASISITANQTVCNKALTITAPTATDNCGIAAVKNSFNGTSNASGTYPVGTTNVVWTATDIHNLTATCTQVITIYPCINITGTANNTICVGTSNGSIAISVNGGNGAYTYHWNNGQTTANLSNLAAGNYTVTVSDASSGSATATFTVGTTVPAAKPATPGAISGLTQFCPNTTTTYSIGSVPYASAYTWSVPSNATIQSGQGTTQITVKFNSGFSSGTVSVLASNCKGNSNKSNLAVGVYAIPIKPVSIIGAATVCSGSTQSYSILSVNGATSYTWSVPSHCTIISGQGSTAVTVQYQTGFTSGNISVYATNCTGSSGVKSLGVGLEPVPNQPGTISGTSSICTGIVYQYLISAVTNASTYTWTVPTGATLLSGQGTTSITLQYTGTFTSGSVSVYASNCTGNGSVKSLAISKLTAPAQPSYVIGTTSVCPNETYQYQVGSVNNASSYTWTVPANATIVSGQGTTTLTVQYGSSFTGGTLSVYASDCAGNSSAKSIAISKATRGCGGTRMDEVDTTESSAATIIEPTDVDFKVILYPNPFASQCRLNITSPSTEPVTLRIYSITGQLIEERTEQFTGTDIIMGNSLASGLYLVEVKQQDRTKVLRFIKSE